MLAKEKRYEFTRAIRIIGKHVLHRIRATENIYVRDPLNDPSQGIRFKMIPKGTLGGWVESRDNLDDDGFAWVDDEACVYGLGLVRGAGYVGGDARVYCSGTVEDAGIVTGNARVHRCAHVKGNSLVDGLADVHGASTEIRGNSHIGGSASIATGIIDGNVIISGNVIVGGKNGVYIAGNAKLDDYVLVNSDDGAIVIENCAQIFGTAKIYGGSRILDFAHVFGEAKVYGATIGGFAWVYKNTTLLAGSRIGGNVRLCFDELDDAVLANACISSQEEVRLNTSDAYTLLPINEHIALTFFVIDGLRTGLCISGDALFIGNGREYTFPAHDPKALTPFLQCDFENPWRRYQPPRDFVRKTIDTACAAQSHFDELFAA